MSGRTLVSRTNGFALISSCVTFISFRMVSSNFSNSEDSDFAILRLISPIRLHAVKHILQCQHVQGDIGHFGYIMGDSARTAKQTFSESVKLLLSVVFLPQPCPQVGSLQWQQGMFWIEAVTAIAEPSR